MAIARMRKNNYDRPGASEEALTAINGALRRIRETRKELKRIDLSLQHTLFNLLYTRRVKFGSVKQPEEKNIEIS